MAFTLSIMATEAGGLDNPWAADNKQGCYGIAQLCSGSFGSYSYENWTKKALGRVPSPQEFMSNPVLQLKKELIIF